MSSWQDEVESTKDGSEEEDIKSKEKSTENMTDEKRRKNLNVALVKIIWKLTITVYFFLLNPIRPTYHKTAKGFPPPCPQILWIPQMRQQ